MGEWKKVITSGSKAQLNTVTASGGFSGSNLNPLLAFDGNRVISNNALPAGVYNVNYETTGDLSDFIEAVFFKNATPTIVSNQNFLLQQFTTGSTGGTFVGNIEGADEDVSQTPEFILGNFDNVLSSGDDNFFSITNNNGVGSIFLNNGITADTTFNIDSEGPQGAAYPLPIIIKDDFGAQSETVVYVQVTPNNAPIIQGSSNGTTFTEITGDTFNANAVLNENNPSGIVENNHFILKFSDSDNDNLVVSTTNLGESTDDDFFDFSIDYSAGTIKLNQITSSLDFDAVENRNFSYKITVHDEHHPTQPGVGNDPNAFKEITFNWSVGNNAPPTITNQSFTIVEDAADGTSVGTVYPSDTDGDGSEVFLFTGFTLISVQLDSDATDLTNTGILSDVSPNAFVPSQDPFEITTVGNGIGQIKKKSGAILNSDIANKYVYTAAVTDIYNEGFNQDTATITINVTDASVPNIFSTGDANIIESALEDAFITTNANGIAGTNFQYVTAGGTSFNFAITTVPEGYLKINGDGTGSTAQFQLNQNISESNLTFSDSDTIEATVIASQTNFNSSQVTKNFTLNIKQNNAPTIGSLSEGALSNTNEANSGVTLGTHTLSDTDSIPTNMHSNMPGTVSFTSTPAGLTVANTSNQLQIKAANNLSAGTYNYTATVRDIHGFHTSTVSDSITITQAGTGTFSGGTQFFIVDTAANGDQIHTLTGYTNGNFNGSQGDINVAYDPDEGSPTLASFASSNNLVNINSSGKLTIGTTISESSVSGITAGNLLNTTITATDNYGNEGTQNITVTVFANDPPIISSYVEQSSNLFTNVTNTIGTHLVTFTIDDDEHDTPYSASLSGTDKEKLTLESQNGNNTTYHIKNSTAIIQDTSNPGTPQTLSFNIVIHDKHGINSSFPKTLTINDPTPPVFIYTMQDDASTWASSYANASLNIGLRVGDHNITPNGILSKFISSGQIGSSSFSADNGFGGTTTVTKIQEDTLTDLKSTSITTGLRSLGVITNDSGPRRSIIVFPSSSLLANKPYSGSNNATGDTNDGIVNSKQNTSNGQYRFYVRETNNNESDQSMFIKYITLDNPSLGYSDWGVIYHNAFNELTHYWYMVDDNDPKLGV